MQIIFDPQISEWGNPPIYRYPRKWRQTRRTETSKYPEEKKTKVIPLVVAIERGLAQTMIVSAIVGL